MLAEDYQTPFAGTNRRDVIKKIGLASTVALPVISALVAPQASHAASGAPVACVTNAVCTCSVTNTSGGLVFCGTDLGGISTNCRSDFFGAGCDCSLQDDTETGLYAVRLGGV